ncbi:hypothetical protein [Flavobacterium undicola]|uniref:hypothetical protein n=1 Tax=Flavobacterium undicola TaxID=1932779 RepID=UPI0013773B80|nr:hypothetical protein [Flavobacterium undicola]MBA0885012.1 hypothetical protein [Flavobacterium undicola]
MKKIFTILLIGILLNSCSNDDNLDYKNSESFTTNMKVDLSNYNIGSVNPFTYFQFEYDNKKRLIKKTTVHPISQNGSINYINDDIYTSIIYKINNVTVEDFSTSNNYPYSKNTNYYTLNNTNQITIREIPDIYYNERSKKMFYKYTNNKLTEITTTYPNRPYDVNIPYYSYILTYSEKFYFDSNGNLSKTEYNELRNGINIGEKTIRTFEDYDTSFNPTKNLFLLNDYFYRSLSKNNYRKFTEKTYSFNSLIHDYYRTWGFTYDKSGNIIIN